MSQARIILKAIGEEDNYLTVKSTNTFFKNNNRTHTQYGSGWIVINNNFKNYDNFVLPNSSLYFRIPVDGDVITETYLRFKLNRSDAWKNDNLQVKETIFEILKSIDFRVHDTVLSKLDIDYIVSYLELHSTWSELNYISDNISYDRTAKSFENASVQPEYVYLTIPIPFWFHKNPTSGFPVWSLNDSNIGVKVEINNFNNLSGNKINDIELLVQYNYLTSEEKEKFKNLPLEYVIEQVETVENIPINSLRTKLNINKTHFIKYLIWNIKDNNVNNKFFYRDLLKEASISINGNGVLDEGPAKFYRSVQRFQFFNNSGSLSLDESYKNLKDINPIYSYSFSIEPKNKRVSGFISSEKFNTFTLECIYEPAAIGKTLNVYIVKHNIIRINNGHLSVLFN